MRTGGRKGKILKREEVRMRKSLEGRRGRNMLQAGRKLYVDERVGLWRRGRIRWREGREHGGKGVLTGNREEIKEGKRVR